MVASLPEHAHLLAEVSRKSSLDDLICNKVVFNSNDLSLIQPYTNQHGCYSAGNGGIECGEKGTTPLPDDYKPVVLTEEMDKAWKDLIYELPLPGQGLHAGENNEEE